MKCLSAVPVHTDEEVWQPVPGLEGRYETSTHGRLKSYLSNPDGRLLVPRCTPTGYFFYHLIAQSGVKPRYKSVGISRIVAATFIPNPNGYLEVDHIDNNKANNHISNLQWIEHDANVRKDQGHIYTIYHIKKPDEVYTFDSSRLAADFIGYSHGGLKHHVLKGIDGPNRRGWVISRRRKTADEKKRW